MSDVSESPIFVLGAPRSGTTLVSSLLHAHPSIAISPETHFLNQTLQDHRWAGRAERQSDDSLWHRWTSSERFGHLGLTVEQARAECPADQQSNPRQVFESTMRAYARQMGKKRWGEKTPMHTEYIDVLQDWFPDARFIFVVRDPRAMVASALKTPWGSKRRIEFWADYWSRAIASFDRYQNDHTMLVTYEQLVKDTESTLRAICEHLGEPYDHQMIEQRGAATDRVEARSGWQREQIAKSQQPINAASLDKWKDQLTDAQVQVIEALTRRGMKRFGYEPVAESAGPLRTLRLAGRVQLERLRQPIGRRVLRMKRMFHH